MLLPFSVVVATRGFVAANATVLGVQRAPAAGAASAILGACMFGGGVAVSPLLALGPEGSPVTMARSWPGALSWPCSHGRPD